MGCAAAERSPADNIADSSILKLTMDANVQVSGVTVYTPK